MAAAPPFDPQVQIHGVPNHVIAPAVPGRLAYVSLATRVTGYYPPNPMVALPAGFSAWTAPHPYTGHANWNNGFSPVLTPAQALRIDKIVQALRSNTPMSYDNAPDFSSLAFEEELSDALNVMNVDNRKRARHKAWAYVYKMTTVLRASGRRNKPAPITLPPRVVTDISTMWSTVNDIRSRGDHNLPRYRYILFPHRHKADGASDYKKPVYTLSVWDREYGRLDWFDTGMYGEVDRLADIQNFWQKVDHNFPQGGPGQYFTRAPGAGGIQLYTHQQWYPVHKTFGIVWTEEFPIGFTLYTVIGLALLVIRQADSPTRVFSYAPELAYTSIGAGLTKDQIPRWYMQLVRMLYVRYLDPIFPPVLYNKIAAGQSWIDNYHLSDNDYLRKKIDEIKSGYVGNGQGRIPPGRGAYLTFDG